MSKRVIGAALIAMALAAGLAYADSPPQQPNVPVNGCTIWWWRC